MGRRVSSGVVGGTGLGSLSVVSSTISSTVADGDITFSPNGTGEFVFESNIFLHDQTDIRFGDADSSNYIAFQAPTTVSSDITWTLPSEDAAISGYALVSNAAGVLSWAAAGAALTDNNSDSGTNYLTFTTSTSGFLTAARVATTTRALTYQPSTGTLSSAIFSGAGSFTTLSASSTVNITSTTTARQLNPETTNTYDLGTTLLRWRNLYTQDLHLSNGIGDYTIIEGEENLYLVNNKTNKSFKFALIEVDPAEVPPKSATD